MKTAAGIREKADALRELLELGQNGGGDEELWGNALIALSDAEARRVVGVVFPFLEWSRRIVTTVYPIFFGDPQGGELRTRPRARAARAHAGARSALFIFSVKMDSSLKLPLLLRTLVRDGWANPLCGPYRVCVSSQLQRISASASSDLKLFLRVAKKIE